MFYLKHKSVKRTVAIFTPNTCMYPHNETNFHQKSKSWRCRMQIV